METVTSTTKKINTLPSPKGKFLLGNLPDFKADSKHKVLENWVAECGPLFRLNFAGKRIVVSADPDMNGKILRLRPEKFRRYTRISQILEEMGVLGTFNAEGDTWRKHRKTASEALSLKKVRGFYPSIASKTERLLNKWQKLANAGTAIDVQKEFMRYTVDVTTEIAFGYPLDTINGAKDDFQADYERIFPMINARISAPIPWWRFLKREKDKELDKAIAAIEGLIFRFIGEARERLQKEPDLKENPSNFLEALLVEQENGERFSDREIYGNVFTMLMAGQDTTANTISWSLFYLAQKPELVARIREEANAVYGPTALPEDDRAINELKLAHAVAQETIRMKPVSPNLFMEALVDQEVNGLAIPKGTLVLLQNKVAQTDETYFTNAADFIPERWIRNACPMHNAHNPDVIRAFGGGPRFCPGKNLATYEMIVVISTLCKHFDIGLAVQPGEVKEKYAFTMFPENLLIDLKPV